MSGAHHHAGSRRATSARQNRARLAAVLGIDVVIVVAELVGSLLSHSLVLLADAAHMTTDTVAVGLSLVAVWLATRPATPRRTFGLQRAEILAATANAVLLFGVSVLIIVEAVHRLISPSVVHSQVMLLFGVFALAGNLVSVLILSEGQSSSLNVRGAFLEVAADAFGAAAVVVAALLIGVTGFDRLDAVASLLIALLILPRTWHLLRATLDVLVEATPRGVELGDVRRHMLEMPGVVDVHDLHAWLITSGVPVLSAHVIVQDECFSDGRTPGMLDQLQHCLAGHFDIEHSTLQLEPLGHDQHEGADHA